MAATEQYTQTSQSDDILAVTSDEYVMRRGDIEFASRDPEVTTELREFFGQRSVRLAFEEVFGEDGDIILERQDLLRDNKEEVFVGDDDELTADMIDRARENEVTLRWLRQRFGETAIAAVENAQEERVSKGFGPAVHDYRLSHDLAA